MAERIVEFEGRRVSVPPDATDDEIASILEGTSLPATPAAPMGGNDPTGLLATIMKGRDAAPAAAAPQPGGSTVTGAGTQFARGARSGLANILGLPVDAMNNIPRLANLLPGVSGVGPISDRPFMGSDFIDQQVLGLGGAIPEAPKPQGVAERVARRFGEEAGASAVPVAGGLVAASRMTVNEARNLPALARMFVEPAAVSPGKFVQGNAAGAAMAATGASVANELTGNINKETGTYDPGLTDLLGAVGGVAAGGGLTALGRGVRDVGAAVYGSPNYASNVVRDKVVEAIIENSDQMASQLGQKPGAPINTDDLVASIMRPAEAENVVPGLRATTADRSGDGGLAALEAARARNSSKFRARSEDNAQAVEDTFSRMAPTEQPAAFRSELEVRRDKALQDAIMRQQQAAQEAEQAVAPITPQTTQAQRGSVIREGLTEARDAARAKTAQAYQDAEIRGKQVDPAPLTQTLDDSLASLTVAERQLIPQDLIDGVARLGREVDGAAPGPMRIEEATTLRTRLQELRNQAGADPNRRSEARVLGQLSNRVDNYITSNLSPEEVAKLDAARGAKFAEAEAFDRKGDPVQRALAENPGGRPRMRDDLVPGLFTSPEGVDSLFSRAKTPAMERALQEEILSRANTARADTIERFRTDYARQIGKFPGLDDQLAVAQRARQMETEANTTTAKTLRELGEPGRTDRAGTSPVGQYLRFDDTSPDRAMRTVLNNDRPAEAVDQLLDFVKREPRAVEGARAAFWRVMDDEVRTANKQQETKKGVMPILPSKLEAFLNDPIKGAVAAKLYADKPEHLDNLREIARVLRDVNTGPRVGNATNPSGSALMQRGANITMAEVGSKMYQTEIGNVSPLYVLTYLTGKVTRLAVGSQRQRAFELLLDKALLEPEVAAQLLKENNPANRAALAKSARAWMGNQASTLINMMDDTEEDPIVKKAMER